MPLRLRRLMTIVTVLAAMAAAPLPAAAQEMDRLAAVVNDEAVSVLDLEMRTRLALLSSNLPDSLEVRRRVVPQVLRKLIEERLQVQEARRLKLSISAEDIDKAIASIEKRNRMEPGQLKQVLSNAGIPVSAMERQAESELAWAKVMRFTMLPRIKVGDDEIDERLDLLKSNLGRPEYLLAEIVLPVEQPENEAEVKRLAERIVEQLQQGARFQALAQQVSQSPSAAVGGDLDWMPHSSLDPEIAAVVEDMPAGRLTPPIRTVEGYHLILMRDRRIAGQGGDDVSLALAQAVVPTAGDAAAARRQAEEIAASAKSCADIERVARERNLPQSGRLGTVKLGELPAPLREIVGKLDILQASQPIPDAGGFRVMMVCGRSGEAGAGLPSRDQIRSQIEQERLELMARRYLRDLRRSAFVDVRL